MRKNLLSVLCCLITLCAFSQQWHYTSPPYSRDVNSVKLIGASKIIIVGGHQSNDSIQDIDLSTNSGLSWNLIYDGITSWLTSVDFSDTSSGLAVGTNGKIIGSADGGVNWNNLSPPLNRDFNKVWYFNSQLAYIAGGKQTGTQTILKTLPMKNILTTYLICFCLFAFARAPLAKRWDKRFGGPDYDYLTCLQPTSGGGYIMGGWTRGASGGGKTGANWHPTRTFFTERSAQIPIASLANGVYVAEIKTRGGGAIRRWVKM